jgi:hypothetical protein
MTLRQDRAARLWDVETRDATQLALRDDGVVCLVQSDGRRMLPCRAQPGRYKNVETGVPIVPNLKL